MRIAKLLFFHIDKSSIFFLFLSLDSLPCSTTVWASSLATLGSMSQLIKKTIKTKQPSPPNVPLQPNALNKASHTGVITTKAPPVLIAIIPVAMERYFTKYRGTISKTAMKTKLKPNPKIPPYVRNIRNKLGTIDVNRRPLALKSEPLATTIRAPKWFVNLPDKGPKRPQPDIAIEPTHAAKEKDILLINQVCGRYWKIRTVW